MSAYKSLDSKNAYSVGWIATLSIERAAATALLDERHEQPSDFEQHERDNNSYSWGRIQHHNVVIASLPAGEYGLTRATVTAQGLVSSLPHIKIGLLVGIGAGIPESGLDIRLGDVAVSRPNGTNSGVIQYDSVKAKSTGWERTGMLARPPDVLLHALAKLESEHELHGSRITEILQIAGASNPVFADKYKHPELEANQISLRRGRSAKRRRLGNTGRSNTVPRIHYGTIASGNMLVKDVKTRKDIIGSIGSCICLEMEAAGLMNSFPCLVIRGISDYADADKNDLWQRYASATAAAFAKELLLHITKASVNQSRRIEEVLQQVQDSVNQLTVNLRQTREESMNKETSKLLRDLYEKTCPYEERKNRNPIRVPGTCEWFTHHPLYVKWRDGEPSLLWVSADPGCGKSVLARFLVDEFFMDVNNSVYYFFFKDDFTDQKKASSAICALLRQSLIQSRQNASERILKKYADNGPRHFESFEDIWIDFVEVSQLSPGKEIICVLDAIDECQESDRRSIISTICRHYQLNSNKTQSKIKVLVTSRPYHSIVDNFHAWEKSIPIIHLSGDNDEEKTAISKEIDLVIEHRVRDFGRYRCLSNDETEFLLQKFVSVPQRTYIWAHLTLNLLEETPGFTKGAARKMLMVLPSTVDEAYNKILSKSIDKAKTKLILHLILAAKEPLTVEMISYLVALDGTHENWEELEDFIEATDRSKNTIRQLCGLFVVVIDSKLYLLHQTAREFLLPVLEEDQHNRVSVKSKEPSNADSAKLEWKALFHPQDSDSIIAERCLRYLELDRQEYRAGPLFCYCASHWINHLWYADEHADNSVIDLALRVCDPFGSSFVFWFNHYWYSDSFTNWFHCFFDNWGLQFHASKHFDKHPHYIQGTINVISLIGIPKLLRKYISKNTDHIWHHNELAEALWWASLSNSTDTARLLLEMGAQTTAIAIFEREEHGSGHYKILDREEFRARRSFLPSPNFKYWRYPNVFDAILIAVMSYDMEMVRLLLQSNICIDFMYDDGYTLLHHAAKDGDYDISSLLVRHGSCLIAGDVRGWTPLMRFRHRTQHASDSQDDICRKMCDLLWSDEASSIRSLSGETILHCVVDAKCLECTRFVLSHKVPVNAQSDDGKSALHRAAEQDQSDIIAELLRFGADIEIQGPHNLTPLLLAIRSGRNNAARQLLDAGADIKAVDNRQRGAFIQLVGPYDNNALTELLFSHGADLQARDYCGASCIHHASNPVQIKFFVTHGVDINAQDDLGRTPLMYCIGMISYRAMLSVDLIRCMLNHGADHKLRDKQGRTALWYAQDKWHAQTDQCFINVLKDVGALE